MKNLNKNINSCAELIDGIFYNIRYTLTYNALFNFIIGNRGSGKTFSFKEFAISHFLKTGKQFIYLRRYKEELKESAKTFFNDVSTKFPGHEFSVKGNKFYIDNKVAGFSFSLSTAIILKSLSFPLVDLIGFDEFIIDKGCYHYLQDEVKAFLEFYETIARMRDVKVFFLANAITMTNPYFLYFNIELPYNKTIKTFKNGLMLIQLVQNKEFIETKEKTKFGQIIQGTDYSNYSINNKFLRDNKNFIEKKAPDSKFFFAFKYENNIFGVWYSNAYGKIYVSNDYDTMCPLIFSTTLQDHTPNTLLLKSPKQNYFWKTFVDSFKIGQMRFENIKIKNICNNLIRTILF